MINSMARSLLQKLIIYRHSWNSLFFWNPKMYLCLHKSSSSSSSSQHPPIFILSILVHHGFNYSLLSDSHLSCMPHVMYTSNNIPNCNIGNQYLFLNVCLSRSGPFMLLDAMYCIHEMWWNIGCETSTGRIWVMKVETMFTCLWIVSNNRLWYIWSWTL